MIPTCTAFTPRILGGVRAQPKTEALGDSGRRGAKLTWDKEKEMTVCPRQGGLLLVYDNKNQ